MLQAIWGSTKSASTGTDENPSNNTSSSNNNSQEKKKNDDSTLPTMNLSASSSSSSPGGNQVFNTPPRATAATIPQQQRQPIHWKSVHHETCVRQTTLTASLTQVIQDDHATIDILPSLSNNDDVLLWNSNDHKDQNLLRQKLLQRFEKVVIATQQQKQQKPSTTTTPTKKSSANTSSSSSLSTSIFSSPPAKLLKQVVWTTATLVATPISYALSSASPSITSDYDNPPSINVDDFYSNSHDSAENNNDNNNKTKDTNNHNETNNKSIHDNNNNNNNAALFLEHNVGMQQPIVDVDLTLDCLVFLHQAMLTSQERILTLPENKISSSSSQTQLLQHEWKHWIRKASNDSTATTKNNDGDNIGAVISDLSMEHTLFLLEILHDFQSCQLIRRQPKDVNLVILPETTAGNEDDESVLQTRITLFDLDCQLQRLESLMNVYNTRIDNYTQQAARHKKLGRSKEAMNCLRHRKLLQAQIEIYQNQSLNLERIQLAVTHSADTNTVYKTFQQAAIALKEMRESSSTSLSTSMMANVDDVLNDLEEELELQHKIGATTADSSSFLTGVYVDDDDLLHELEQLDEEEEKPNEVTAAIPIVTSTKQAGDVSVAATTTTTTTSSTLLPLPAIPLLNDPTAATSTTTIPTSTLPTSTDDDISEKFQQQLQLSTSILTGGVYVDDDGLLHGLEQDVVAAVDTTTTTTTKSSTLPPLPTLPRLNDPTAATSTIQTSTDIDISEQFRKQLQLST